MSLCISANFGPTSDGQMQFEPAALLRSASSDLFNEITLPLSISIKDSRALSKVSVLEGISARVEKLSLVTNDWDSYDTDGPSKEAIRRSLSLLSYWQSIDLSPDLVLASSEGGVALDVSGRDGRRALVETLNTGVEYIVLYDSVSYCETIMLTDEENQISTSFAKMSEFLRRGRDAGGND